MTKEKNGFPWLSLILSFTIIVISLWLIEKGIDYRNIEVISSGIFWLSIGLITIVNTYVTYTNSKKKTVIIDNELDTQPLKEEFDVLYLPDEIKPKSFS